MINTVTKRTLRLTLVIGLWLLFRDPLAAQIEGSIAGVVRDPSGAVLPGATVTVKSPRLQRESVSAMTGPDGTYRVHPLPPGVYQVNVELHGFAPRTIADVIVDVNERATLDVTLVLAGVTDAIDVVAEVPLLEVARSDVTGRIAQATIDGLPLNGRKVTDLMALVPGAKPDPGLTGGANVEIFGERAGAVSYLVDGADNNDPVDGGMLLRYSQDAIGEFEVITTGYDAAFGRALGGVANIVTRSGTNAPAGRAFAFARDDALDASNVPGAAASLPGGDASQPPTLRRVQWGATFGGPLRRDRAFVFGSFERLRERRGANFDLAAIPAFVREGTATPGHHEDFSLAPETRGETGLVKVDVNQSANHRLTASVSRSTLAGDGILSSPVAGALPLPSAAASTTRPATGVVARETAVLGDSWSSESTVEFVRGEAGTNIDRAGRAEPILLLLGSGFLQTAAPYGGRTDRRSRRLQLAQALTVSSAGKLGRHQLTFGGDASVLGLTGHDQSFNDVEYSPDFFSEDPAAPFARNFGLYGFQQSAARFFILSGKPDGSLGVDIRSHDVSAYAQDAWQLRPDLTLNVGARYDHASLFGAYKKALAPRLGLAWDVAGHHRTIVKAHYGLFFDRNLLAAAASVPDKGGVFDKEGFDVALPRLGVDYANSLVDYVISSGFPTGPDTFGPAENPLYGRFAADLRADPLSLYKLLGIPVSEPTTVPVVTADNILALSGKTPAQALALIAEAYPGTDFRFADVPGGSIVGDRVLAFFPRGPLEAPGIQSRYARDRVPHTNAFSVGVDRQLGRQVSLSATYVRRRTRGLLTRRIVNLVDANPGDVGFGRTIDGGPLMSEVGYDGLVDYDGVVLSLRKAWSMRHQFGLSYAGSRARDNLLTGSVGSTFSNNNHPERDYGPSNQSAPHIFTANGLVALPSDVSLGIVGFWRTGAAFDPRGIIDSDGDGLVDQRDLSQRRNAFRVKAYADLDFRVEKKLQLGRHVVSLLWEIFNAFNRDNVANVNAVAGPQFGQPVAYLPGREMQLGLRYSFGS